jgi:valyl-tRNA synthetase
MDLPKAYNAKEVEADIYKTWEESGYFNPDNLPGKRKDSFTISMPPPNATGKLHTGHAVMLAIEDIFTRHARMQGKAALWLPGTDHAAIATESVVIKKIQKEERIKDPRKEYGRDKLIKKIADFVEDSKVNINTQIRAMGSSCDWSRESYTMEPALSRVVNEVFKKMYDDGLIYRGHRIVNWDPKLQTTVSDDEIEWQEAAAPFYYFQYGPFEIGTARPETKFGDKYVVMHPDDKRYKQHKHRDTFEAEWINGPITATIIKDKAVDPEFGSGVMTITPWHDRTDFEIAERHDLDKEQIIDYDGKLLPIAGEFEGMKIAEAREKIVAKLKDKDLLVKVDKDYTHNIAISDRGKAPIEPQIKQQWFIDVNKEVVKWHHHKLSLKRVMQKVVRDGDVKIIPARFNKIYFNWIDNLHDWCISRQIWWGHRIPVWYKGKETFVGHEAPGGDGWQQDPDTLDTWFSSALWTWSTLIDKELALDNSLSLKDLLKQSQDFKTFHPTTIMETGYDILFFWVARMILMTTYATDEIPFKYVYLHGLVRDKNGQKMSKSKPETIIDPLDMIDEFGTDALRLALIVGQTPGNDQRLSKDKIAGYSKFINKIWNISRYVLISVANPRIVEDTPKPITLSDKWILHLYETIKNQTDQNIDHTNPHLSMAIEQLYEFTWSSFADWYVEISKYQMQDENLKENTEKILLFVLGNLLKLFHPFIPFLTEHIWALLQATNHKLQANGLLMVSSWPESNRKLLDEKAEQEFVKLQELVVKIRNWRAKQKTPPKEVVEVNVAVASAHKNLVESLARVKISAAGQKLS